MNKVEEFHGAHGDCMLWTEAARYVVYARGDCVKPTIKKFPTREQAAQFIREVTEEKQCTGSIEKKFCRSS